MQTSVLRFPKADRFVRIHASLMAACDNNACAAALVVFFEGWHNYKLELKEYTALYNQMAEDAERAEVVDLSGWQYHTNAQLEAGVMLYKIDTINRALDLLESKEFISTDVPERLVMFHKTGRTRWFLLRADKINEFFDLYQRKMRPAAAPARIVPKRDITPKQVSQPVADAIIVFDYWKARLNHPKAIADAERLTLISDRVKQGRSILDLCMAIEGCARNPYHQGQNERKKIYDRVQLIFADMSSVERFMGYADEAKVLPEVVQKWIDNPALMSGAPDVPSSETITKYSEAVVKLVVPLLVVDNWPSGHIRQIRALTRDKPELLTDCLVTVKDRIDATEGMFSEKHQMRFDKLVQEIQNGD